MKLYLGLRPKAGMVHYPVIRTVFCGHVEKALEKWADFTHVIFTSQTAVEYWPGPWDKKIVAIGLSTASALREKGCSPVIAPEATQEGVMQVIEEGYYLLPRSRRARSALTDFMKNKGIRFFVLDLYDTVFQKLEPVPDLSQFDEIIFSSPSTVEGFLRIFGKLPQDVQLTAIGPITKRALQS